MVEKIKNYIQGIGSVLDIYPADRDLSVHSHIAPSQADAFRRDMEAIGGDFRKAIQQETNRVQKAD